MDDWKSYFSKLLNVCSATLDNSQPILPVENDLEINTGPITIEETRDAITQLKFGKAPGLIKPIPKKGDLTQMTNYRGISLMSHAAKLYNRIILNRISEPIDTILRPNQAGFRKGRSSIDQIHIIRTILAAAVDKKLPLYITFVDFKKAFDSINREQLFQILRHYGIPEKIVQSIKFIYNNSRSSVLVRQNIQGIRRNNWRPPRRHTSSAAIRYRHRLRHEKRCSRQRLRARRTRISYKRT